MKRILHIIFEKYGLLKILVAFIILAISAFIYNHNPNAGWIIIPAIISIGYIGITMALFLIAGIVNTINDFKKK